MDTVTETASSKVARMMGTLAKSAYEAVRIVSRDAVVGDGSLTWDRLSKAQHTRHMRLVGLILAGEDNAVVGKVGADAGYTAPELVLVTLVVTEGVKIMRGDQ